MPGQRPLRALTWQTRLQTAAISRWLCMRMAPSTYWKDGPLTLAAQQRIFEDAVAYLDSHPRATVKHALRYGILVECERNGPLLNGERLTLEERPNSLTGSTG